MTASPRASGTTLRPSTVGFDPIVYANPKARAATIMTATAFVEIAPEGWIAGGRECERCPFTKLCGRGCTAVPARDNGETKTQFAVEIADLARQAKQHEADRDCAEVKLSTAQNTIRDRLREHGVRHIESENVSALWSTVKGRQSWDHAAIREATAAAGVDIEKFTPWATPSTGSRSKLRSETNSTPRGVDVTGQGPNANVENGKLKHE
jgi:hypothetical protein